MKDRIRNSNDWQSLLQLAERGDAHAQLQVAMYYDAGVEIDSIALVQADPKLAYDWIKKAYENGNSEATEFYAYHLSNGVHCAKNTALAMKLYKDAMKAGSPSAAFNLGIEFRDQHNFEKAFALYKKEGTDLNVGMCYYYGVGVKQNKLKAFRFFKNLIKSGIPLSGYDENEINYMIGRMYLEGEVVKRSIKKARHHLLLANEDGDHRPAEHILWIIGSK
ncbi:MAG: tetratricopeptide repeat protein [Bacteroidota bacterium]